MNWFVWRQHRKQFLIFGGLLAIFAAFIIPTGIHFWNVYQDALLSCAATGSCGDLQDSLFQAPSEQALFTAVLLVGWSIPFLLGIFLGVPLLAREYEDGTNKLVWTQSVSRRKWLTTKLLWALVFAALYGLVLSLLTTWWSHAGNMLYQNRFIPSQFDIQGLMPVAYAVFATALGAMVGAWFKRTMLAVGITLALLVIAQASFVAFTRAHYVAPVTENTPLAATPDSESATDSRWILSSSVVDNNGRDYDTFNLNDLPDKCKEQIKEGEMGGSQCLNSLGYKNRTVYQPAYRYWNFQRIETGIYLGMAVLAVGTTYWLVLKRDA